MAACEGLGPFVIHVLKEVERGGELLPHSSSRLRHLLRWLRTRALSAVWQAQVQESTAPTQDAASLVPCS